MSSSIDTYVIIPLTKYSQLENAVIQKQEAPINDTPAMDTPAMDTGPDEPESEETPPPRVPSPQPPQETPKLSQRTKTLVRHKALSRTNFAKFLDAVKLYGGESLQLPNLTALIKSALGKGRRILESEEEFYHFLSQHGLSYLVKNPNKIERYFPTWYRV